MKMIFLLSLLMINVAIQATDYNGNFINKNKIIFNNNSTNSHIQSVMKKSINFDGLLDQTFGGLMSTLGTTYLPGFPITSGKTSIAVQPDGKIVIAGTSSSDYSRFVAARFLPNGQVDTSFGGYNNQLGGTVTLPAITGVESVDNCYALVLQPDGNIVLAGSSFNTIANTIWFAAARLLPSGHLDITFGGHYGEAPGIFCAPIGAHIYYGSEAYCVTLQNDGYIVLGGYTNLNPSQYDLFSAVRLQPDGQFDFSFGNNNLGVVYIENSIAGGYYNHCYSIALQNDGKIVMGGPSNASTYSPPYYFAAARLTPNGQPDESFGGYNSIPGTMYISQPIAGPTGQQDICNSIALQSDGKIVMGGLSVQIGTGENFSFGVARLLPNGHLDQSFGGPNAGYTSQPGTLFLFSIAGGNGDECKSVFIQPDGKIVLGGWSNPPGLENCFAVARLELNGALDKTFGGYNGQTPGTTYASYIKEFNIANTCFSGAFSPDGKIILGGTIVSNDNYFALVTFINPMTLTEYQKSYVLDGLGMY